MNTHFLQLFRYSIIFIYILIAVATKAQEYGGDYFFENNIILKEIEDENYSKKWILINNISNKPINHRQYDCIYPFENNLATFKRDGKRGFKKYGFLDRRGNEHFVYDDAHSFNVKYGLASIQKKGEWGMIDTTGKIIIPFQYAWIDWFEKGVAIACKNGKIGCINALGQTIIPFEYQEIYQDPPYFFVKKNDKIGVLDYQGLEIIPIQYEKLSAFSANFFEGLYVASAKKNNKYGYIDTLGREIISIDYDSIYPFSYDYENCRIVKIGELYGLLNKYGQEVIPIEYETINYDHFNYFRFMVNDDSTGYLIVQKHHQWGLLDKAGNIVLPIQYDTILTTPAEFYLEKNKLWGLFQPTTKSLIPPQFDSLNFLLQISTHNADNQPIINSENTPKGEKWHYFDMQKKALMALNYDSIGIFQELANNSYLALVKKNNKCGYSNLATKIVIPIEYDSLGSFNKVGYDNYLALAKKNGNYGYIDTNNHEFINIVYDSVGQFSKDSYNIKVKKDNKYGYITASANSLPPELHIKWYVIYDQLEDIIYNDYYNTSLMIAQQGRKFGLLNQWGREVIPIKCNNLVRIQPNTSSYYYQCQRYGRRFYFNQVGERIYKPQN